MKKLLVILFLLAYVFGDTCDECESKCKEKFTGAKLESCLTDCIIHYC